MKIIYPFPISFQFFIKIIKPYIPETSSNKSAQTPSIIGAERPVNIAENISKTKIILPTFGTAPISNARENIIVGQGTTPNNRIVG